MTGKAGERLFEAIGQIPDAMVLEAAQEQDDAQTIQPEQVGPGTEQRNPDLDSDLNQTDIKQISQDEAGSERKAVSPRKERWMAKLGGYLKYLPVVACLCLVFGGAGYIVNMFAHINQSEDIHMSGSLGSEMDGAADGGAAEDTKEDALVREDAAQNADGSWQPDEEAAGENNMDGGGTVTESGSYSKPGQTAQLPVRYDAYEGPVFPLTATGDTQKLRVSRSLRASVTTEDTDHEGQDGPLLQVTDTYKLRNTSQEDKTLQIVYPFVTTLNQAYESSGEILQIEGEDATPVAYSIGDSISAYRGVAPEETASMEDYEQIFGNQTDYQERALEKEADWNKTVQVYTFSDIRIQEDTAGRNRQGVIGITVKGEKADVFTYGFDHSFETEDGSRNHCFFIPQDQEKVLLIVTGEPDEEPELGYYTNLDCEEVLDGIQCEMSRQEMSYAAALRLCSTDAAKRMKQMYEQGMYDAVLPDYMSADAAFDALTAVSEEEDFYDTLTERYQSLELSEILRKLFGETRVVYARTTVTIPAGQAIRAVAQTQKPQNTEQDLSMGQNDADKVYPYDFLSAAQSQLQIKKTAFRLELGQEWQLTEQNLGLKQTHGSVWKAVLKQKSYYFSIAS